MTDQDTRPAGPQDHESHQRTLRKVRALLAKAEATPYPEEAEIFTAKAHELMARHAIEQAVIEGVAQAGDVASRSLGIDDPYARAKFSLLSAVARSNRCEAVLDVSTDQKIGIVFGFGQDLTNVEVLYTSLLVQVTSAMMAHGSVVDSRGRNRTRSFRSAFLFGFAHEVGNRFEANRRRAERNAAVWAGDSLLPVLADRADAIEQSINEMFPEAKVMGSSVSNSAGLAAGQRAGAGADIGQRRMGDAAGDGSPLG